MSSEDMQNLRSAYSQMMTIRDNRGYNFLAGIHGVRNGIVGTISAEEDLILPCVFSYLGIGHIFTCSNRLLRTLYRTVYIPWWDWRSESFSH